jgi:hypothetical protein
MSDETSVELTPGYAETIESGRGSSISENSGGASTKRTTANPGSFDLSTEAKTFGEYELLEEIARGGMGVVYRARDQRLGREVALKVILSGQFASANDVRRFQMEAESAAGLDHPGIVPIYEIGEHDGHHFYTMKLVSGGSFANRMPDLRKDIRGFVLKMASVAEAVDYAHRRGILHRDLKPANLLFDDDDQPLVTDLGLAKNIQSESDLTGTGAIVGTPAYMPPEQASASKEITTSADVYALGAILYEGLVGTPPHQGESAVETLMMAAQGEIRLPSESDRKVDRTLERICMKCLSHDPTERYSSSGLLAKDLRAWHAGDTVSVRPKSFASAFGDVLTGHFRSALGAMVLGLLGGIALGVPCYSGLASRCFGDQMDDVWISGIGRIIPRMQLGDAWWLHPPEWTYQPATFVIAIIFTLMLGLLIEKLVRPSEIQQAIAFGLVAGLLMTIVQFTFYGIGAGFETFRSNGANDIKQLTAALMASEPDRADALQAIHKQYPEVAAKAESERSEFLGDMVSLEIMLSMPFVFVGCLLFCLTAAAVSCVVGAFHAHRVSHHGVGWANQLLRYGEVMIIFALIGVLMIVTFFYLLGMSEINSNTANPLVAVFVAIAVLFLATLPGLFLARWFVRWPVYGLLFVICAVL